MLSFFKRVKSYRFLGILKELWSYLWIDDRKIRCKLIFSFSFNLLTIAASISTPILFARIVDSSHSFSLSHSWFLTLLAIYVGIWSLSKVCLYLREITMFPVMERAIHLLAFHLFRHIQLLPFQYHLKRRTGEITGTIETAIQSFPPIVWYLAFTVAPLIVESLCVLGIVTFICGIYYSLILVMCVVFYVIVTRLGFIKALRALRKSNLIHLTATSKIVDSLLNFSSAKYFHAYDFEFKKINKILDSRETQVTHSLIKDQMIRVYQTIILSCSFLLLMIFTGYNLMLNKLSLGEFIMIHTYMLQFTLPLENFGQIFQMLNQNFVKMEKVLRIFKKPLEDKRGFIVLDKKEPLHIKFEDVWFGYQKEVPILKGVTFELFSNQTLAIVGETGSGKSTIISLLLGFLKPWKGRILINEHDLKDIDQESLISSIGIVPQDVVLFNDTLSHNILYADMLATQKQLKDALNMASLNETVQKLSHGLETIVGEQGAQLSGGEKQRVGLARAIIRQPKLYIFDEATSSLDSKTERQIIKNIETISHNASTLVIAHRLSTIAFVDRIIFLENGLIKEKSYRTLLEEAKVSHA